MTAQIIQLYPVEGRKQDFFRHCIDQGYSKPVSQAYVQLKTIPMNMLDYYIERDD